MNFSVDKTKNVLAEINQYQTAALKALLLENISLAREWYLAGDAAAHFLRRKKGCELLGPPPSSLIHEVATLMLSAQKQYERLSNFLLKSRSEAMNAYNYWIACSQTLSSSNPDQLLTHLEVIKRKCRETFSVAIPFLQEAERYFKTTYPTQGGMLLSEQQLLSYHWSSIIYDAFFLANSKTGKMTPLAEEIFLARMRAASAIKAHHHQRAHTWSLIAFVKGNIFKIGSETLQHRTDEHWKQSVASFEEQLLNGKESEAWQRGLCWLLIAAESKQKEENFNLLNNKIPARVFHTSHSEANKKADETRRRNDCDSLAPAKLALAGLPSAFDLAPPGAGLSALAKLQTERHEILRLAHRQTADYASRISRKWQRVSNLEMGKKLICQVPFLSKFLTLCWTRSARRTERRYHSFMKTVLLPEVTFCLPPQLIPTKAQEQEMARGIIHPELQYTVFYNWIYQTWHFLTQAGIPCQLSKELPNEGILVTLGQALSASFQQKILSKKIFLVDVVADNKPCAASFLHLSQNKVSAEQTVHSLYVPHWPQPYLIPRDPRRKNRFENICFFGNIKNLAPEFQSPAWQENLQKELGLTFKIKEVQEWHDYSNVDCILAIRDFSASLHLNKPGTKLYNAWLAGVPFIGGNDTAYAADGRPGKDYLVATSLEEVFQHLRRLKKDEAFRMELVKEGKKSAPGFTQQATLEHWKNLVLETIPSFAIRRFQKK